MLSFILVPAVAALAAAGAEPAECPAKPAEELVALGYDRFDTGGGQTAWRTLLARGCTDPAVATLVAYRNANQAKLTREQLGEINFHVGQALTMSGRDADSIPHFAQAAKLGGSAEWSAYVAANLAFVRKDKAALAQAVADYAKLVKPGSMRLTVIRGFLRCIDKPYMVAAHCEM
jgi:hypothetical protein